MIASAPNILDRSRAPATSQVHPDGAPRLPDGRGVLIRPIHPDDDAIETAFIKGLSRESCYNRLLGCKRLTPEEIRRLTRIDYEREMALIAVDFGAGNAHMLGVARYVKNSDGSGAEFALVVADAWQRRGVGSLLLGALLRHAHSAGIARMHGITLATNQGMQNLARKFGFALKQDPRDATVRLVEKTLALTADAATRYSDVEHRDVAINDDAGMSGSTMGDAPVVSIPLEYKVPLEYIPSSCFRP